MKLQTVHLVEAAELQHQCTALHTVIVNHFNRNEVPPEVALLALAVVTSGLWRLEEQPREALVATIVSNWDDISVQASERVDA